MYVCMYLLYLFSHSFVSFLAVVLPSAQVSFVGPLFNGNLHHAGYSGAAVGPVSNQWSLAFLFPNFTQAAFTPDLILLHIGYL